MADFHLGKAKIKGVVSLEFDHFTAFPAGDLQRGRSGRISGKLCSRLRWDPFHPAPAPALHGGNRENVPFHPKIPKKTQAGAISACNGAARGGTEGSSPFWCTDGIRACRLTSPQTGIFPPACRVIKALYA